MSVVTAVITGAAATTGGIATQNLNNLRALVALTEARGMGLAVLSMHEKDVDRPSFLPAGATFRGFSGNKRRLAASLAMEGIRKGRKLMVFDHVTLALPVLPHVMSGLVRTVVFAHGSESWRRVRRSSRWSFRHASLTLANSEFTRSRMLECGIHGRVEACPLGLSPDAVLNLSVPALPSTSMELEAVDKSVHAIGPRMLLLVARMHPGEREKGHDEILNVWPAVLQKFPDAQLVFAGPGEDRPRLAQKALEMGVGSTVFLPGRVPAEMLQNLFHRCYAHVMPSRQEGFGLVHLEAMNFGKPCVGCHNDGAADVIVNEETGLLVENPGNPEELTGVLLRLLGDEQLAARMGAAGSARLHERFTAEHVQDRVRRMIEEVLPC
jgi:glycosyltransferase involved in cell wall biosynthesis